MQPRHSGSRGLGLGPGLPQQELGDHGLHRNSAGDAALRGSAPAQHGPSSQDSKHISEIESCVTDSFNFILSRTLASVAGREMGQLSSRAMQVALQFQAVLCVQSSKASKNCQETVPSSCWLEQGRPQLPHWFPSGGRETGALLLCLPLQKGFASHGLEF